MRSLNLFPRKNGWCLLAWYELCRIIIHNDNEDLQMHGWFETHLGITLQIPELFWFICSKTSQHLNTFHKSRCVVPRLDIWCNVYPDSKVHGANMGPTWVLSAPDGPHVGPMNPAIRVLAVFPKFNSERFISIAGTQPQLEYELVWPKSPWVIYIICFHPNQIWAVGKCATKYRVTCYEKDVRPKGSNNVGFAFRLAGVN